MVAEHTVHRHGVLGVANSTSNFGKPFCIFPREVDRYGHGEKASRLQYIVVMIWPVLMGMGMVMGTGLVMVVAMVMVTVMAMATAMQSLEGHHEDA